VPIVGDESTEGAKKLDLVEVTDRELYVRKANYVRPNLKDRLTSRKPLIIVNQQCM
jgi:hypothetical protein